jgi:DNA-directed RNA polymerase subunit RPC12/RpoP
VAARLLKRFVCAGCGATGPMPSGSPFIQCASCGAVGDYDLGAARANPDWPRHEALSHELHTRHKEALDAARDAGDRERWVALYAGLTEALVDAFPSAYPPRVGEPAYRAQLIAFHAAHCANLQLDADLVASLRNLERLSGAGDLWAVFDAAVLHFELQDRTVERLGPPPPEDFVPRHLRRFGVSMMVQEWLPQLALEQQREMVQRLGVAREYVEPGGTCRSCGAAVALPAGVDRAPCPYCGGEVRLSREGLGARAASWRDLAFIDGCVARIVEYAGGPVTGIELLDGPVERNGHPWRQLTLRGRFAGGARHWFYENTDRPEAESMAETLAWLEVQERMLGPAERRALVEHPRALETPAGVEELERRLAEAAPGHARADVHAVSYGESGYTWEIDAGDTVIVLVHDEAGAATELCRSWSGAPG